MQTGAFIVNGTKVFATSAGATDHAILRCNTAGRATIGRSVLGQRFDPSFFRP